MNPTTFLIALAALSIGTYVMRFAGVKVGAALAVRGRRRALATTGTTSGTAVDIATEAGPAAGTTTGVAADVATEAGATTGTTAGTAADVATGADVATEAGATTGPATAMPTESETSVGTGGPTASASDPDEPTSRVTAWMDRATVVLIGAVFATTAVFDGQALADPARLIGVGAGVLAAVLRVPMLVCVILAMAVCAGIRWTGIL